MSEMIAELEPALHARLVQWAHEQQRPLPSLVRDILLVAERVRENYDPTMMGSTKDIRRIRDGGCGLCDEIEPLFARGKTTASIYWLRFVSTSSP